VEKESAKLHDQKRRNWRRRKKEEKRTPLFAETLREHKIPLGRTIEKTGVAVSQKSTQMSIDAAPGKHPKIPAGERQRRKNSRERAAESKWGQGFIRRTTRHTPTGGGEARTRGEAFSWKREDGGGKWVLEKGAHHLTLAGRASKKSRHCLLPKSLPSRQTEGTPWHIGGGGELTLPSPGKKRNRVTQPNRGSQRAVSRPERGTTPNATGGKEAVAFTNRTPEKTETKPS